jgi:hypothetical protein
MLKKVRVFVYNVKVGVSSGPSGAPVSRLDIPPDKE